MGEACLIYSFRREVCVPLHLFLLTPPAPSYVWFAFASNIYPLVLKFYFFPQTYMEKVHFILIMTYTEGISLYRKIHKLWGQVCGVDYFLESKTTQWSLKKFLKNKFHLLAYCTFGS